MQLFGALMALMVLAPPGGARAEGDAAPDPTLVVEKDLLDLERQLGDVARRVALLSDTYIRPQQLQPTYEVQSRLNDGQVAYFLQDYLKASILFFDIVEDPRYRKELAYKEALFYLADSLYQNRNYVAARKYFSEVMNDASSKYYAQSLAKIVSIALVTGHHEEVDQAYLRLAQRGSGFISPEIQYLYAKSLFERKELERAATAFSAVAATSPYFFQARSFLGATHALRGKYEDAARVFQEILVLNPEAYKALEESDTKRVVAQNRKIMELARLALGRLYHDLGDIDRAVAVYQDVDRKSESFPEALLELAYCWIKGKAYEKARRALEILMLSRSDLQFVPEAQVLLGDLQVLLDRPDDATKTYNTVKETFEPVRKELSEMLSKHDDPVRYFNSLLVTKLERMSPSALLPPLAARWVQAGEQVVKAMELVRDTSFNRDQINESKAIIEKLEAALSAKDKLEMFPLLRDGRAAFLELESQVLQAKRRLGELDTTLIEGDISESERQNLAAAVAERQKLDVAMATIPKSREEYLKRREAQQKRLDALQEEVHKLGIQIDGLKAQLVAAVKYWQDTRGSHTLTEVEEKTLVAKIEEEKADLAALGQSYGEVRARLAAERARVGVGDEAVATEDRLRQRYTEALERERAAKTAVRGRLSGRKEALARQVEALRGRFEREAGELTSFREKLGKLVEEKAREFRHKVETEKKLIALYDDELKVQEKSSEQIVGQVAYANYKRVQKKFYNLLVLAERGLTEVVWREKEKRSKRVKQFTQDKKTELKVLEDEFKDVLQEEE
jgi:tetratricopeptide (TPR) repeat protein